jgi:hypothetical protein
MTDFRTSTIGREVLASDTGTVRTSTLAREVLLSQVTQLWTSVIAREVLLMDPPATPGGNRNTAVTINTG